MVRFGKYPLGRLNQALAALLHPDGKHRCPWPGQDPFYVAYHDDEWGVPERDDRALYEKLMLDGFQAGLSWITILRNRQKIEGAVASARAYLDIMEKGPGFSNLLWGFVDGKPKVNLFRTTKQVPAETPASRA